MAGSRREFAASGACKPGFKLIFCRGWVGLHVDDNAVHLPLEFQASGVGQALGFGDVADLLPLKGQFDRRPIVGIVQFRLQFDIRSDRQLFQDRRVAVRGARYHHALLNILVSLLSGLGFRGVFINRPGNIGRGKFVRGHGCGYGRISRRFGGLGGLRGRTGGGFTRASLSRGLLPRRTLSRRRATDGAFAPCALAHSTEEGERKDHQARHACEDKAQQCIQRTPGLGTLTALARARFPFRAIQIGAAIAGSQSALTPPLALFLTESARL